jgi:dimethylaniline monooxygenase (N-oxide forming)
MLTELKVAIIGAGASGLATAKEMLDQGLKPTLFEKNSQIGGVWRQDFGNVWSNMHTNNTRFSVSFSSYQWPKTTDLYPSGTQVQDYLLNFSNKFDLMKYIKFGTIVTNVKQLEDKRWLVKWLLLETAEEIEELFDFLVLAIGSFSNPLIPKYKSLKNFKGKVIHSKVYNSLKSNENLNGKRIIVVGHAFSATEICSDLVEQGADVLNVFRRPCWVLKKSIKSITDEDENTKKNTNEFYIF